MEPPPAAIQMPNAGVTVVARPWPEWKRRLLVGGAILGGFLVVCWAIVIADTLVPDDKSLVYHGIIPRTAKGLIGIISSPFIHINFSYMWATSLGVILLGGLLMLATLRTFFCVTAFVWIFGGFFTWVIGRPNVSIVGAGIICFGWFGYLMITPFFARPINVKFIVLAVVTGLLYGGLIFSLFSGDPQVAWEASLAGALTGAGLSVGYWYLYKRILYPKYFSRYFPPPHVADPAGGNQNAILHGSQQGGQTPQNASLLRSEEPPPFFNPFSDYKNSNNASNPNWLQNNQNQQQQQNNTSWMHTPTKASAPPNSSEPSWMHTPGPPQAQEQDTSFFSSASSLFTSKNVATASTVAAQNPELFNAQNATRAGNIVADNPDVFNAQNASRAADFVNNNPEVFNAQNASRAATFVSNLSAPSWLMDSPNEPSSTKKDDSFSFNPFG